MNAQELSLFNQIKQQFSNALLLFRVGDFYEAYNEDAENMSKVLEVVLTSRTDGTPLASFSFRNFERYIPKLVVKGFRVAICDSLAEMALHQPTLISAQA